MSTAMEHPIWEQLLSHQGEVYYCFIPAQHFQQEIIFLEGADTK